MAPNSNDTLFGDHPEPIFDHLPEIPLHNKSTQKCNQMQSDRQLIGYNGYWYDVTSFVDKHPGGEIINRFIGEDCTAILNAYRHPTSVFKHLKPVAVYYTEQPTEIEKDFNKLIENCEKRGWYKTDWTFYIQKMIIVALAFAAVWCLVCCFESKWIHYLGAIMMAFLWQQSGYLMHDFMHGQIFRSKRDSDSKIMKFLEEQVKKYGLKWTDLDRAGGMFFGTTIFGMSAHWWQDEHIFHHGLTNVVDVETNFADPQMRENIWAQSTLLFPLFKGWLNFLLIKIQHITFIPAVVFCGRFEMLSHSYRLEKRWYEWIAIILHWTWIIFLLKNLPTWGEIFTFYFIASSIEGTSHFQIILSHYCRDFQNIEDFHKKSWFEAQIVSNMNISCPSWFDWYYGGLNLHIEHHLFPKLGRNFLRPIAPEVEKICQKHGVEYGSESFTKCVALTLKQLKNASTHYELDPR